jgi:hypothetical protein
VGGAVKLALLLLFTSSCLFSQSANCGEDYERNMTHIKPGLYKLDGELAGLHEVRLKINAETVDIATSDGRSTQYRR